MSLQTLQEFVLSSQADGPALTGSAVATSILPADAKESIPPKFWQLGSLLTIRAAGRISNVITTPGTLTLDLRLGAIIIATSGAIPLNVAAKTNVAWWLEWILTCRAVGAGIAANVMHQGTFASESVIASAAAGAGGIAEVPLVPSAPAVGNGFDSTIQQTLDMFATWSLSNANSIQVHQFLASYKFL